MTQLTARLEELKRLCTSDALSMLKRLTLLEKETPKLIKALELAASFIAEKTPDRHSGSCSYNFTDEPCDCGREEYFETISNLQEILCTEESEGGKGDEIEG